MTLFSDRPFYRLALIGAAVAALTLAGCGRKGPLDPPPGASMASEPQPSAAPAVPDPVAPPLFGQSPDARANQPPPPTGPNKRIFLDNLLN